MSLILLKGFPECDWGKVLKRLSISRECGISLKPLSAFIRIIYYSFVDNNYIRYEKNERNSNVLFYQTHVTRPSSRQMMQTVSSLIESDFITQDAKRRYSFHLLRGFHILFVLIPDWFIQLKKSGISKDGILEYLLYVIIVFHIYKRLVILTKNKHYNLLVTYCDSYIDEAFVSQFFHNRGITTATLQHGAFTAWRENEFINSGVELRSFNSDFLLCWNQMTVEEGLKVGIPKEKLLVLGIVSYIEKQITDWVKPSNGLFGVVLGHESFEEENINLIKTANLLARKTGYKFLLKLHPNYPEHYFDDIVDKNSFVSVCQKGISIPDYANQVDFSLVGSSTVFVELVYINHNVIRYSSGSARDKFKDVAIGKVVNRPEQILEVCEQGLDLSDNEKTNLFNYLCGFKDVRSHYMSFFSQYC